MSAPPADLVYESQSDARNSRDCGVACLRMVYGALGKEVPSEQIWRAIAKQNASGSFASTTHLMAKNAQAQGFAAAAIKVRYPLQALKAFHDSGIFVVLNHRLSRESGTGHYSVLVNIDREKVILHDPLYGPSRSISHTGLLELWQPGPAGGEIAGQVLIGIAGQPQPIEACRFCKAPFPAKVDCPKCKEPVQLQPSKLFGCVGGICAARTWNCLYCPSCDFSWTFALSAPPAGAKGMSGIPGQTDASLLGAKVPQASPTDPWNLAGLFGQMDKFNTLLLSSPAAANHPEIQRLLGLIEVQKDNLYFAQTEALVSQKALQDKNAQLLEAAKQKMEEIEQRKEAQRKKAEGQNAASPPLDPDALRVALLKNLGWTK